MLHTHASCDRMRNGRGGGSTTALRRDASNGDLFDRLVTEIATDSSHVWQNLDIYE